jgi:predicted deacylase
MNPESVQQGVAGIKNYLRHKKILTSNEKETNLQSKNINLFTREQVEKYYATSGGMIQNRVALGTKVKAGAILYQILKFNRSENLPEVIDIYAQNSGLVFDVSTNYSVNQGEYVLSIFKY